MRVLVTGGAGFIGSHTVDLLISKGYDVKVFDNLEKQVHLNKKPNYLNPKAKYFFGDIRRIKDWTEAIKDVDAIIHLAALVGVGQSMYQPKRYLIINTIGTSNLYEILIKKRNISKRIKKIIVASSKSIYGEGAYYCKEHKLVYPNLRQRGQLEKKDWEVHCPYCNDYVKPVGINEDKPVQNLSIYALSKYDTERIAINLGFALKIPTIALRYFNVYGPRQSLSNPYTGVLAIFLSRIKNNRSPIIFEDGKQMRDFIYVGDIAYVNLLALESDRSGIYNVGTGRPVSILEVAKMMLKILDSKVQPIITEEYRYGDNRHDFADISKIREELKFQPKWSLEKGIESLVEWASKENAIDMFDKAEMERKKYLS
jgi:dTDP-L-rhamnose 4-epimerase